jgi:CHAD domain-containing protein
LKLDVHGLDLPAAHGARALVTALFGEAEQALTRLESGDADEALHDFRVSLRRLRSVIRALRPQLGERVQRKHERRLREVARATTAARDAEVQLAWLRLEHAHARERDIPALDWLGRRLEARRRDASGPDLRALAARFHRLARRLSRKLAPSDEPAPRGAAPSFGTLLADLLRAHAAELLEALEAVGGPFEVEQGHAARIAAKRLRYILEPLRGNLRADSAAAVATLKELQDLLGELHDAHVAGDTIAGALVEAAAERARRAHGAVVAGDALPTALRLAAREPLTRGLLVLDRRAGERAATAYGSLVREWLPARRSVLVKAIANLADALAPRSVSGPSGARRFLLVRLPDGLPDAPPVQVDTGWLPGPPPRVRLWRVLGPDGVQFFRGGEDELSAHEEIAEETFIALWPTTEGARLAKRRRVLVYKGHRWSLHEIPDLRLVLADVAEPIAGALRFPRGVKRVLVREVTEERAYRDQQLAARRQRPTGAAVDRGESAGGPLADGTPPPAGPFGGPDERRGTAAGLGRSRATDSRRKRDEGATSGSDPARRVAARPRVC